MLNSLWILTDVYGHVSTFILENTVRALPPEPLAQIIAFIVLQFHDIVTDWFSFINIHSGSSKCFCCLIVHFFQCLNVTVYRLLQFAYSLPY
jgi:hypothetical protein